MASASTDRRARDLMWAATLISAATIVSRLMGFFRNSLIADFFGQTAAVDQYNAAYVVPDTIYLLLIGGAISSAFVPVLSSYLTRHEDAEATRIVNSALSLVLVVFIPLLALGELLAPLLVRLVAVGFDGHPAAIAATAFLTRIMLAAVLFHALNGVLVGHQYAKKTFWATAIGPLGYNLAIIAFGWLLAHKLGIAAFAWGVLAGAAVNFIVQVVGVLTQGHQFQWVRDWSHPGLKRVGRLMIPVAFGVGLSQLNLVINQTVLASLLPVGSINALNLASRIMMTPESLAASLAIALLPSLAEVAQTRDYVSFRRYLSRGFRVVIAVTVPAAVLLMLLAFPLVALLFLHGRFDLHNAMITAGALVFYSIGIVAWGGIEVMVRAFYALHDTKSPVLASALALVVGFGLDLLLLHSMRQDGLALAYSLTGFFNLILLVALLRYKIHRLDGRQMLRTTVRTGLITAIMAAGVLMGRVPLARWLGAAPTPFLERALALTLLAGVAAGLYLLGANRFHLEEWTWIAERLRRKQRPLSSNG